MKQKMVIKVCTTMCCDKCRSKVMAVAAAMCGVESVTMEGKYQDELVVVGDCVDSVKLTNALRKKVGKAHILQVSEVVAKKDEDKKPAAGEKKPAPPPPVTIVCHYYHHVGYACPWCGHYTKDDDKKPPPVTIVCHYYHRVGYACPWCGHYSGY